MPKSKIIIQGELGSFHEEAALRFFGDNGHEFIPSDSFVELANKLDEKPEDRIAIMAIENSIAGSILQNYRILREHKFRVVGEVYLRIKHNLMAFPGQSINDLEEVRSHPMALNQCLEFFTDKNFKLIETEDTALSAKRIADRKIR
jgi:prephenate dehydratase